MCVLGLTPEAACSLQEERDLGIQQLTVWIYELAGMDTSSHVSSHVSGVVTCTHPLQGLVLLCTLLYTAIRSTDLYFKPRMSGSKCKSSSNVVGIAKKHQLLYCPIVLFKALYCKMNYFYAFSVYSHCACFLCIHTFVPKITINFSNLKNSIIY